MSESDANVTDMFGDDDEDVSTESQHETPEAEAEKDEESSPAEQFGTRLGLGLAVVALAWAFAGPAHLLDVGRFELPIVASFVEPLPYAFFAYLAGVTFVVALAGALAVPSRVEDPQEDWASDFATGLIVPTVVLVGIMIVLGFLVPAVFYAVSGELARAGMIVVGVVVVGVGAVFLQTIVLLAVAVAAAPLWVPAFAGAHAGSFLRGVTG